MTYYLIAGFVTFYFTLLFVSADLATFATIAVLLLMYFAPSIVGILLPLRITTYFYLRKLVNSFDNCPNEGWVDKSLRAIASTIADMAKFGASPYQGAHERAVFQSEISARKIQLYFAGGKELILKNYPDDSLWEAEVLDKFKEKSKG